MVAGFTSLTRALREPVEGLPGGLSLSLSGSIGLALHPRDGDAANRLIQAADQDMYRRKSVAGDAAADPPGPNADPNPGEGPATPRSPPG